MGPGMQLVTTDGQQFLNLKVDLITYGPSAVCTGSGVPDPVEGAKLIAQMQAAAKLVEGTVRLVCSTRARRRAGQRRQLLQVSPGCGQAGAAQLQVQVTLPSDTTSQATVAGAILNSVRGWQQGNPDVCPVDTANDVTLNANVQLVLSVPVATLSSASAAAATAEVCNLLKIAAGEVMQVLYNGATSQVREITTGTTLCGVQQATLGLSNTLLSGALVSSATASSTGSSAQGSASQQEQQQQQQQQQDQQDGDNGHHHHWVPLWLINWVVLSGVAALVSVALYSQLHRHSFQWGSQPKSLHPPVLYPLVFVACKRRSWWLDEKAARAQHLINLRGGEQASNHIAAAEPYGKGWVGPDDTRMATALRAPETGERPTGTRGLRSKWNDDVTSFHRQLTNQLSSAKQRSSPLSPTWWPAAETDGKRTQAGADVVWAVMRKSNPGGSPRDGFSIRTEDVLETSPSMHGGTAPGPRSWTPEPTRPSSRQSGLINTFSDRHSGIPGMEDNDNAAADEALFASSLLTVQSDGPVITRGLTSTSLHGSGHHSPCFVGPVILPSSKLNLRPSATGREGSFSGGECFPVSRQASRLSATTLPLVEPRAGSHRTSLTNVESNSLRTSLTNIESTSRTSMTNVEPVSSRQHSIAGLLASIGSTQVVPLEGTQSDTWVSKPHEEEAVAADTHSPASGQTIWANLTPSRKASSRFHAETVARRSLDWVGDKPSRPSTPQAQQQLPERAQLTPVIELSRELYAERSPAALEPPPPALLDDGGVNDQRGGGRGGSGTTALEEEEEEEADRGLERAPVSPNSARGPMVAEESSASPTPSIFASVLGFFKSPRSPGPSPAKKSAHDSAVTHSHDQPVVLTPTSPVPLAGSCAASPGQPAPPITSQHEPDSLRQLADSPVEAISSPSYLTAGSPRSLSGSPRFLSVSPSPGAHSPTRPRQADAGSSQAALIISAPTSPFTSPPRSPRDPQHPLGLGSIGLPSRLKQEAPFGLGSLGLPHPPVRLQASLDAPSRLGPGIGSDARSLHQGSVVGANLQLDEQQGTADVAESPKAYAAISLAPNPQLKERLARAELAATTVAKLLSTIRDKNGIKREELGPPVPSPFARGFSKKSSGSMYSSRKSRTNLSAAPSGAAPSGAAGGSGVTDMLASKPGSGELARKSFGRPSARQLP